ncbi:kinesin-related protein k2 [Cryptosporidium ubiquitum]|uniref:Kinesin-like protein n=1 Tax=Cryptosporidium ubiquitum TaxID=857276 RepID=A0A1J4MJ17_9CRYT|nr:kinesin-related protein k2 [Cryptosporidium ubiquitum]OII74225.1 kinesin-related protein k2 [Cryptosporidium ubiquitum]
MKKENTQIKYSKSRQEGINIYFQEKINDLENKQAEITDLLVKKKNDTDRLIIINKEKSNTINSIKEKIAVMVEDHTSYINEMNKFKKDIQEALEHKRHQLSRIETKLSKLKQLYIGTSNEHNRLKKTFSERTQIKKDLENRLELLNETIKKKYWANTARLSLAQQIELANQEILSWRYRLQRHSILLNDTRRKLFNELQDIKGNIRVFCRIRPPTISEQDSCIKYDISEDASTITIKNSTPRGISLLTFKFDYIFSSISTQSEVFEEVSQLIQSALDGYNVSLFSYGQTGSGKTFTMMGGKDENEYGMIPRALNLIFESIDRNIEKGWSYHIEYSAIEVYNETIRDLTTTKQKNSEVKIDQFGSATIVGINSIKVGGINDINNLLKIAQKNRSEASTDCNERSSRSHSIIQLKISGKHGKGTDTPNNDSRNINSTLSLIDLAGSERASKSGVTGERMKETQFINKSLSALGDVIQSINLEKDHIPFRNSKLTMILKNSLGGNSKAAMLVHISPSLNSINETISSLRFASKVQNCITNRNKEKN